MCLQTLDCIVRQVNIGTDLGGNHTYEPSGLGLDILGPVAKGRNREGEAFDPREKRERKFTRSTTFLPRSGFDGQDHGGFGLTANLFFAETAVFAVLEKGMKDRGTRRR
ncbi:MAG: hypothetical protein NVSMB9_11520 [Isosphaeraceae bacterium]